MRQRFEENDHDRPIREFLDVFRALTVQSITFKGYARDSVSFPAKRADWK